MNPEPLHAAGRKVSGLKGEASAAGKAFLDSLEGAKGAVHHDKMAAALGRYHGDWSKPANQLPTDVDSTGNKISRSAVIGVDGDDRAKHQVMTPSVTTPSPMLRHGINIAQ